MNDYSKKVMFCGSLLISSIINCMDEQDIFKALTNSDEVRKLLLADKTRVNERDFEKATPLHLAALYDLFEAAQVLVENGANVNALNLRNLTPLHLALAPNKKDNKQLVLYLVKHGAKVDAQDCQGNTPLHYAAYYGHCLAAQVLLLQGASIDAKNTYGDKPLDLARKKMNDIERNCLDFCGGVMIFTGVDFDSGGLFYKIINLLLDWQPYNDYFTRQAATFMLIRDNQESSIRDLDENMCKNVIKYLYAQKFSHTIEQVHEIAELYRKHEKNKKIQ